MADFPISIKPEREYLHEILSKLKSGVYAIPLFQRSFVWDKKQILDLFDSISKGYPIGSILLWRPKNKNSYTEAKDIVSDKIIKNPGLDYFVLDGRQRLTTFFGCLIDDTASQDNIFKVYFNLETKLFEYSASQKRPVWVVPLPEIYDTFRLLDRLNDIREEVKDPDKAKQYILSAKRLNSIFQGYQIGELLFENYTLEEAGTVFARINSKGTDISKVSMLQALFYKENQTTLFSDWVNEVRTKLGKWGFCRLREEDILNCCYKYSGLNFYDHDLLEKVEKLDFIKKLNVIEEDLMREAEFLHKYCGVITAAFIPYARQWVILSSAFKENRFISEDEKKELRKWLYYTTVCQSFMNSSMSVVRSQARRFERYIAGDSATPIDYKEITIPSLSFNFQLTSALSCFLMIALTRNYVKYTNQNPVYLGEYKALGGKNPIGLIPYFSEPSMLEISNLMNGDVTTTLNLESIALNEDLMELWNNKDLKRFEAKRKVLLLDIEKNILEESGISITPYSEEND